MGMALSDDRAYLKQLYAARLSIATGGVSSYSVPGRSVTKLSLGEINKEIARVEANIAAREGGLVTYASLRGSSMESDE